MLLGKLVDTQHGPSDTSRRTHKIPYFSDGIKSGLYLDMLVPTFPGDGWGVARCDMNTEQKSSQFRAIIFVVEIYLQDQNAGACDHGDQETAVKTPKMVGQKSYGC